MKTPDYVGTVLFIVIFAVSFMFGYAMSSREASVRIVTAEQLGVTPMAFNGTTWDRAWYR